MRLLDTTALCSTKWSPPCDAVLVQKGADKEARDGDGMTPLHWAAQEGHLPVVQYLCEQGADKAATDEDDWAVLYGEATLDHLVAVQYLREQGADIEATTEEGYSTPLLMAAHIDNSPVMQYLCSQGADKKVTDIAAMAYDYSMIGHNIIIIMLK